MGCRVLDHDNKNGVVQRVLKAQMCERGAIKEKIQRFK